MGNKFIKNSRPMKASIFNLIIANAFTLDNQSTPLPDVKPSGSDGLSCITFSSQNVHMQLTKQKSSKTVSPDGFSSYTLKTLGDCLCDPLSLLFEYLSVHSHVPMDWKQYFITPIHKKGLCSNPENYRPISITSIICRIMERIVHEQVLNFLNFHHSSNAAWIFV